MVEVGILVRRGDDSLAQWARHVVWNLFFGTGIAGVRPFVYLVVNGREIRFLGPDSDRSVAEFGQVSKAKVPD